MTQIMQTFQHVGGCVMWFQGPVGVTAPDEWWYAGWHSAYCQDEWMWTPDHEWVPIGWELWSMSRGIRLKAYHYGHPPEGLQRTDTDITPTGHWVYDCCGRHLQEWVYVDGEINMNKFRFVKGQPKGASTGDEPKRASAGNPGRNMLSS